MTDENKHIVRDEIILMQSLIGFMVLNPDAGPLEGYILRHKINF